MDGDAQYCDPAHVSGTTAAPPSNDPAFQTAMFALIGVTCLLLITNSTFIIL